MGPCIPVMVVATLNAKFENITGNHTAVPVICLEYEELRIMDCRLVLRNSEGAVGLIERKFLNVAIAWSCNCG